MSPMVWCAMLLLGAAAASAPPEPFDRFSAPARAPRPVRAADPRPIDDDELNALSGGGGGAGDPEGWYKEAGPGDGWRGSLHPALALYLTDHVPRFQRYYKRKMPSLSISNPMEVLRERLILEIARKQMREQEERQAQANRVILQNIGK